MSLKQIFIDYADGDEFLLMPSCCYNGNRFDVLPKEYPPMFAPEEARIDMPVTITDVPRLCKDGTGRIEVTTGDVATPCVAIYHEKKKKATFVFTVQQVAGHNLGLAYERGKIELTAPAKRKLVYRWPHMRFNDEVYEPDDGEIPVRVFEVACESMEDFFRFYFEHRKCMGLEGGRAKPRPFAEQFEMQKNKFNASNWHEDEGFYDIDAKGAWQPGWVGGGMTGYALMKLGGSLEKERAVRTLHYMMENQAPSGLFYGIEGKICDGFGTPGAEKWLLVRKSADALYFLYKHFALMDAVPEVLISGARKTADCFVRMWRKFGQFGQFADCDTGDVTVGGSSCGAIVPAALIASWRYFGDEAYLQVAKESGLALYQREAQRGYTTGGPGEILQGPDSESAFALLESLVALYEATEEHEWLERAQHAAHLCSTWVVSYNYRFPETSEFGRLQMKTVGCVFANVQNKHAAPGVCTLSADSLYKLWRWTDDPLYLELFEDIGLIIGQFMSTQERPIHSWSVAEEELVNGVQGQSAASVTLPQGYICERVNLSDWEGYGCVGGVFCGSCWCETSNLLTLAEWPEELNRP